MSNIGNTKESVIDYYNVNYPWEYYKKYPEFCIKKLCMTEKEFDKVLNSLPEENRKGIIDKQYLLNIDRDSLKTLSPLELRDRNTITNWLSESSLTYDDIIYVGW